MWHTYRIFLPLFLVLVTAGQWLLARAKDTLTIEDKARLVDAMFRPRWGLIVFAVVFLVWFSLSESLPRALSWWSLAAFTVVIVTVSAFSAASQVRALVHAGVARSYVRMQLWVFIVTYIGILIFLSSLLYDSRIIGRH